MKEEENKDLFEKPGNFIMRDDFTMVFLARYESDQQMVDVFNNIPHSEMMQVLITHAQTSAEE